VNGALSSPPEGLHSYYFINAWTNRVVNETETSHLRAIVMKPLAGSDSKRLIKLDEGALTNMTS